MAELKRKERLEIFFQRLADCPSFQNLTEALAGLSQTLNGVEDEFTKIPFDPDAYKTDGRLYPPQADSAYEVEGFPGVTRLRSLGHNTFIADNGAIEIRLLGVPPESGDLLFEKSGSNGKGVWQNEPA